MDPGESPRPTYERLENYEVFEERKTKWMVDQTAHYLSLGNKMKKLRKRIGGKMKNDTNTKD